MARRYLGAEFDIHGGGLDLRFPHHENERAQSLGAGDGFARYWLHNAWVVMAGEKMSKSLGNVLSIATLTEQVRPVVLRFALSAPHYRSNIELSGESLEEATTSYERIETFVVRAAEQDASVLATPLADVALPAAYEAALDDDLGTPAGVAVLHDTVRAGNSALAAGRVADAAGAALQVRAMADVLGVDPLDPHWATGSGENRLRDALDHLVRAALDERQEARKTRDWARADALRDRLVRAGIAVEDTAEGARWTLQRPDPADPHELGDN
jgi:cysteinyl-tRNA synthetase